MAIDADVSDADVAFIRVERGRFHEWRRAAPVRAYIKAHAPCSTAPSSQVVRPHDPSQLGLRRLPGKGTPLGTKGAGAPLVLDWGTNEAPPEGLPPRSGHHIRICAGELECTCDTFPAGKAQECSVGIKTPAGMFSRERRKSAPRGPQARTRATY